MPKDTFNGVSRVKTDERPCMRCGRTRRTKQGKQARLNLCLDCRYSDPDYVRMIENEATLRSLQEANQDDGLQDDRSMQRTA